MVLCKQVLTLYVIHLACFCIGAKKFSNREEGFVHRRPTETMEWLLLGCSVVVVVVAIRIYFAVKEKKHRTTIDHYNKRALQQDTLARRTVKKTLKEVVPTETALVYSGYVNNAIPTTPRAGM